MRIVLFAAIAFLFVPAAVRADVKCEERDVSGHHAKLCLDNPGMFKHWLISLEVDSQMIFVLVDDYAENISLTHTVPEGLALELPLSKQGKKEISISGGCVPMLTDRNTEVGRRCNFKWGDVTIINQVEFTH